MYLSKMDSSSKKARLDNDSFEEGEENESFTIAEFINDENDLEEVAEAVLGGSDQNECSYSLGYVKRQAVFACSDCCDLERQPAGICYSCSLNCHDGHDVYELYTKRNFRCDCGNEKFSSTCQFYQEKQLNERNRYNHNFQGLYCNCNRPYPDEDESFETEEDGEMVQCVICEDWYHTIHNGLIKPPKAEFEMVCEKCTKQLQFLGRYKPLSFSGTASLDKIKENAFTCGYYDSEYWMENSDEDKKDCSKNEENKEICKKRKFNYDSTFPVVDFGGSSFWPYKWRTFLCKCKDCSVMYEKFEVSFIVDENDTVESYEIKGKENRANLEEKSADLLRGVDRRVQVEMLHGYHDLKNNLLDYFKDFADSGKTVTKEDVTRFFAQMKEKS